MENQSIEADHASLTQDGPNDYLSFKIGEEEYAIDIQNVQELRRYETVTHIANSPDYVKGVINLRGIIVPILDMRIKLRMGPQHYDDLTVVIIVNLAEKLTGIVVDSVSDVVTLAPNDIKPAPMIQELVDSNYLLGLGSLDSRMLIVVDIARMINSAQIGQLNLSEKCEVGVLA
ncbi:chemotaxis protein CheW [Undibacterium fentianense]|uniref:Chemotaxis protein CheW n=1 Tax=Undibacterium fentianense TaxID=2828728 RepID=A0A941IF26_9BURK|nr:chemotaxis protein CheW [Undibacterium fentianense]MBR7801753.1 chemotaxis protein CheW [Undibacterium fentianense]